MAIKEQTRCPNCNLLNNWKQEYNDIQCLCGSMYTQRDHIVYTEENNREVSLKMVANQEHYTQFEVQPMEYCQRNKLGWCASNVVKYVSRENKKDGLKDLYKAMDYLRCLIYWRETGIFLTPDKLEKEKK